MNTIMVDGTGMCGACRVVIGEETKFACVDGPEFDGHLVDWNIAQMRSRMFVKEEKIAMEACSCGGDGHCHSQKK
jgi:ferredoxin--NADP+ reductase